jgi:hypothetical protein
VADGRTAARWGIGSRWGFAVELEGDLGGCTAQLDELVLSVTRWLWMLRRRKVAAASDFIIPSTCQNDSWQAASVTPGGQEAQQVLEATSIDGSGRSLGWPVLILSRGRGRARGVVQIRPGRKGSPGR